MGSAEDMWLDEEPECPTVEPLELAATKLLQVPFLEASDSLVAELNGVGHELRRETADGDEPLATRYISINQLSEGSRLLVALEVWVAALRFSESRLRPAEEPQLPKAVADWSRFSEEQFRRHEFSSLSRELQTALENDLRFRLWNAAEACARAHDVPHDPFRIVDITDEGAAEIAYCAFARGLHLGFTFIASVWEA